MTTITKITTDTNIVLVERAFDRFTDAADRKDSLIRVCAMQRAEILNISYDAAAAWVINRIEAGILKFA